MLKDYSNSNVNIEEKLKNPVLYKITKLLAPKYISTLEDWEFRLKYEEARDKTIKKKNIPYLRGRCRADKEERRLYRDLERDSSYDNVSSLIYYNKRYIKKLTRLNIGYRDLKVIVNLISKAMFIYLYNKGKILINEGLGGKVLSTKNKSAISFSNPNIAVNHFYLSYNINKEDENSNYAAIYECYPRYQAYKLAIKALVNKLLK